MPERPHPSDADIPVGLIGYGTAGAVFHAPLIAATPGLRLAAVVTGNAERAAHARAAHPGVRVVASAEALWAEAIRLVVVASPNRTHAPLAHAALGAGLPVVVDKPLATTAEDAARLVEEAGRRGLMLAPFHNRRWDGDFLTLRHLIEGGALGAVARFESRFERWRPVPKPGWRQSGAPGDAGGVLYDLGPHLIDQALVLFGPVARVYAELDARYEGADVDADAFVALTHASGVRSHLWMSSVAAQTGPRFRVLGSRGAYTKHGLDVQEGALREGVRPGDAGWGREAPAAWGTLGAEGDMRAVETALGGYERFYAGIVRALRDGAPLPVEPADAVTGLRIIEAARRSAAEGRTVSLDGG